MPGRKPPADEDAATARRTLPDGLEPLAPPGIEVRLSGEEEFGAWLDVVAEGSARPDAQGVPWHEPLDVQISRAVTSGLRHDPDI